VLIGPCFSQKRIVSTATARSGRWRKYYS